MGLKHENFPRVNRRHFVKASLAPLGLPLAASLGSRALLRAEQATDSAARGPDIVDTNIHLFDWPFRKLKYANTEKLIGKLRKHRIT